MYFQNKTTDIVILATHFMEECIREVMQILLKVNIRTIQTMLKTQVEEDIILITSLATGTIMRR